MQLEVEEKPTDFLLAVGRRKGAAANLALSIIV